MRPHYLISILIAVVLFGAGFAYVQNPPSQAREIIPKTILRPEIETATTYRIPVLSHTTVLDAMNAYATTIDFTFSGSEFPGLGLFVEEINGQRNGGGYYWTLFINNELSEKGVSQMEVSPSDTVEWRYQKGV